VIRENKIEKIILVVSNFKILEDKNHKNKLFKKEWLFPRI